MSAEPDPVTVLDHRDPEIARQIHALIQASYAVERDLIEVPDFPPLRVTVPALQGEPDTFLGYRENGRLDGVLSFTVAEAGRVVDIGRLVVDPRRFREGIASRLLRAVESRAGAGARVTVGTAARNVPAVALYEKHGYRIGERRTLPDGLVLVRLVKQVP